MSSSETEPRPRIMSFEIEIDCTDTRPRYASNPRLLAKNKHFFNAPFGDVTGPASRGDISSTGAFLDTGVEFYSDLDLCELALPELAGPNQVATYACAATTFFARAIQRHGPQTTNSHYRVARAGGESSAFHENYNFNNKAGMSRHEIIGELMPFLVARILFNGAGIGVESSRGNPHIAPAQRARLTTELISVAAHGHLNKPWMINRDENFGQSGFKRLQITGGDPNISPWATYISFGIVDIALTLMEHGVPLHSLRLQDPLEAAHNTAYNPTGRVGFRLANGNKTTVINLNRRAIELADQNNFCLTKEQLAVLSEWAEATEAFDQDMFSLNNAVDWILKQCLVEKYGAKTLAEVQGHELFYDKIAGAKRGGKPIKGQGIALRDKGWFRHTPSRTDIEAAVTTPPQTRAAHRAKLVQALHHIPKAAGYSKLVNWNFVKISKKNKDYMVKMDDPYGALTTRSLDATGRILEIAAKYQ